MTSDSTDQYVVYLGKWTNWSRGPVFGATLTLSREDANLLIAFVAFFVATGKSPCPSVVFLSRRGLN
jgi:hypothetical protein